MTKISLPIKCKGRNAQRKEVLGQPVHVQLVIVKEKNAVSISVDCPYNVGDNGHRCKASHPTVDKVGDGISCPYAIDLPGAIDQRLPLKH